MLTKTILALTVVAAITGLYLRSTSSVNTDEEAFIQFIGD